MNAPVEQAFAAVFGPEGPLAQRIGGYRVRAQQHEMAEQVASAIRDCATLVCEAGTGTGKTVAYLVPALVSGGKVIISTGTKTLQDQLYQRDLPLVRDALKVSVTTALLKGRAAQIERQLGGTLRFFQLADDCLQPLTQAFLVALQLCRGKA